MEFMFTVGEQEWFAVKGFSNDPTRCQGCRAVNRARQTIVTSGAEQPLARPMHAVTCAHCGNPAHVPFLPRLDKPVYCSTCFDRVRVARLDIVQ